MDENGIVTDTYDYDAFGELRASSSTPTDNAYRFAGQQFDPATGLYSMRARYYDPSHGRFLSRDTYAYNYQNPIELNRYAYAKNSPTNGYDPTGLFFFDYGKLIDNISSKVQAVLTSMGQHLTSLYTRNFYFILKWLPFTPNAACLVVEVSTDADMGPACAYLPDAPPIGKNITVKLAGGGHFGRQITDFVRNVAHRLDGLSMTKRNIGVGRFKINGGYYPEVIFGISGSDTSLQRFVSEKLLSRVAQRYGYLNASEVGRETDSEIKILDEILNEVLNVNPPPKGSKIEVELFTERYPCNSCGGSLGAKDTILTGRNGVIGNFVDKLEKEGYEVYMDVYFGRPPNQPYMIHE